MFVTLKPKLRLSSVIVAILYRMDRRLDTPVFPAKKPFNQRPCAAGASSVAYEFGLTVSTDAPRFAPQSTDTAAKARKMLCTKFHSLLISPQNRRRLSVFGKGSPRQKSTSAMKTLASNEEQMRKAGSCLDQEITDLV